jgi:DNA-binding response OmpR family regulator
MTHVLLVEDDAWLADVESGALRSAGFDVRVAPNALAAIDIVDT